MKGKFQVFHRVDVDAWYWRYRSRNGKIMAIGGEPFRSPDTAKKSIRAFCRNLGVTGSITIEVRK